MVLFLAAQEQITLASREEASKQCSLIKGLRFLI